MTCEEIRAALRADFDAEQPPSDEVAAHVDSCDTCAAYRQRLLNLDALLMAAPTDHAPADLASRVRARVARDRRAEISSRQFVWAVAAAAVIAVGAGFISPASFTFSSWTAEMGSLFTQPISIDEMIEISSHWQLSLDWRAVWSSLTAMAQVPAVSIPLSRGTLFAVLAAAALALVIFNGLEARRLQPAGTNRPR